MTRLKWGILATGTIARKFAEGLKTSKTGELIAVASRREETARSFAESFQVERFYGDYQSLLEDPDVEIVYISTPHTVHAEWVLRAAAAGKHILCEKPLTARFETSRTVIEAVERHNVFLMEAFMYRCYCQTRMLADLIRRGRIGRVRLIRASFGFTGSFPLDHRVMDRKYGGGGILDVGCYTTSMSRLIAGSALGKPFVDPIDIRAMGHVGESSGVDEYALAMLRFPDGIFAQVSCGIQLEQENTVQVFGTEGRLTVPEPWFGPSGRGYSVLRFYRNEAADFEEIRIESPSNIYAIEADEVAACLVAGEKECPAVTWEDTLGNMRVLEDWYSALGVSYEERVLPL